MRDSNRKLSAQLTNEFLKQIPRFREASHHLLVCATNMVRRLDPAFLRPGRFDCLLPVGPPRRGGAERHLDPLRRRDHRRRDRHRRAGEGKRALYSGRHRVRRAQGGSDGVRAGAFRRTGTARRHRRFPRRHRGHETHPHPGDGARLPPGRAPLHEVLRQLLFPSDCYLVWKRDGAMSSVPRPAVSAG